MSDQHDIRDSYEWNTAPAFLMTRRQLRAAGLRPNGADPVAEMVRQRRGRRLIANLYDSREAPPKRSASPAQLVAVAKAVRGRQLAAAVRRGLTEQQLTTAGDPGTAWTTTVVTEEGNPMSDNQITTTEETAESVAREHAEYLRDQLIHAEAEARTPGMFVGQVDGAPRAVGPAGGVDWVADYARRELHTHLGASRHLLGEHPDWKPRYAEIDDAAVVSTTVKPVGHAQRTAQLHAVAALNQSRHRRQRRDREQEIAVGEGTSAVAELAELRAEQAEAAKQRLSQPIPWANRDQLALRLTDALAWREELDVADNQVTKLVGAYAHDWGVRIDVDKAKVRINPAHDAAERQAYDEAALLWDREAAVIDIVSASGLDPEIKGPVMEAIERWHGPGIEYSDPQRHHATQAQRRAQLAAELAELPLPAQARAYLDVTVDYLRGDVTDLDLLATPVSVDPGEEARGRIGRLLDLYAGGGVAPQEMAVEIAVMTPQDQQLVREIGSNIRNGGSPDLGVWPDYIDRDKFTESLLSYISDAAAQRAEADYIAERTHPDPSELGIDDDIEIRLQRMATDRDTLHHTITGSRGLTSTERHQLTAVLADIDTGRVLTREQLPELLFLDERTKSEVDHLRESAAVDAAIADLPREVSERVVAATGLDPENPVHQVISTASEKLHDTVRSVARGGSGRSVEQNRELFLAQRNALGKALGRAGVGGDTMGQIRTMVDASAKSAAETRTELNARRAAWPVRVDEFITNRDQAATQNTAAAATGQARACRTRTDRAAAQSPDPVPAPAPETAVTAGRGMRR